MIRSLRSSTLLHRRPVFSFRRDLTTLGLRREDPKRIWERRTALTPDAIKGLLSEPSQADQLQVEVESCGRRCFSDQLYAQAGAKIVPSLSGDVDVVLGIKEPPLEDVHKLIASGKEGKERKWMMFSHTHKGQTYNTPLLAAFLSPSKGQILIDHELLTAPSTGKDGRPTRARVAAFGWYAGAVGAGEALSMTGIALLKRGIASPLLHLARPYAAGTLAEFKASLRKCGEIVRSSPASETNGQGPIVIGVTGAGNVSTGAKEMLDELNVEWVKAEDLAGLRDAPNNRMYACMIPTSSYIVGKSGAAYDRTAYYKSPDQYKSLFAEKIAPYLTTIINGVGWSSTFPRTISNSDLPLFLGASDEGQKQKLVAVQDITCDKEGGLEFVNQFTTIDEPYFEGPGGILISSIDILPTELAADASAHFSSKILPYVRMALFPDTEGDKAGEEDTLQRAKIVDRGELLEPHRWLLPRAEAWSSNIKGVRQGTKKKVLLLGSGLVAGPAVEVFAARSDVHLAVASNNLSEAKSHIKDRSNVEAICFDVGDEIALGEAVAASDVVVSLLPAPMHPQVAKHCIDHSKHLVTASYVSPEMKALDQAAKEKDVILLGECGLDPGIDSMAAMRILDRVKRERKKVTSFVSWCGGLPEPSASNVPLRYKFSWSPKAVLTAAQNDAHYKMNNEIVKIPGDELLSRHFPEVKLWPELPLEGLANRDSMPYAEKYGLGEVEGLKDLFRGTLRYQGFSTLLESFRRLGLLRSDLLKSVPENWEEFLSLSIARQVGYDKALRGDEVSKILSELIGGEKVQSDALKALRWFSLLPSHSSNSISSIPLPNLRSPVPIDLFAHLLSHKLAYQPGERDTCLLHHSFTLSPSSGEEGKEEKVTASLLHYGDESSSAMSVTVGKTLAFAALRVLDGQVRDRGVTGPYEREVWEGTLDSLESVGVVVKEEWN
uniref:Alpha-aminoadipic semialdehyde synthase n=1 Tax=Kwoniella bestiolae CBS 10118 TaxID=1296100 RepID=A0A1B9G2D5_9TREE|nr:alpha-aminoadipic semialdehyde synthase [Kwoniella bestiolae CBS 10118]OCF25183.1 alpha-aminoadipic semialdehyde synthase [Kwoniella bestiolae CBS 10118]